jgi:hypothetical protein
MLERLRAAIRRFLAEENLCPICDRSLESPEILDRHIATEHRLAPPIVDEFGGGA